MPPRSSRDFLAAPHARPDRRRPREQRRLRSSSTLRRAVTKRRSAVWCLPTDDHGQSPRRIGGERAQGTCVENHCRRRDGGRPTPGTHDCVGDDRRSAGIAPAWCGQPLLEPSQDHSLGVEHQVPEDRWANNRSALGAVLEPIRSRRMGAIQDADPTPRLTIGTNFRAGTVFCLAAWDHGSNATDTFSGALDWNAR